MSEEKKNKAIELTDEELSHAAGGTNGPLKRCGSCNTEYDYNAAKCPNCSKSTYYTKHCGLCYTEYDYYGTVCPNCHSGAYDLYIHNPVSTNHSNPR